LSKKLFLTILLSISIFSCSGEIRNLHFSKEEIEIYYESGEYYQNLNEIINYNKKLLAEYSVPPNSVFIFDIDETSLNNYEYMKQISFGYFPEDWKTWVNSAKAPAISPVKDFYEFLISKNISIVFLTGRSINDHDATKKNLHDTGNKSYDTLILRQNYEKNISALQYKTSKRKELKEKGFHILGSIGDQESDLEGGFADIKIKLPNYIYYIK